MNDKAKLIIGALLSTLILGGVSLVTLNQHIVNFISQRSYIYYLLIFLILCGVTAYFISLMREPSQFFLRWGKSPSPFTLTVLLIFAEIGYSYFAEMIISWTFFALFIVAVIILEFIASSIYKKLALTKRSDLK